MRARALSACAGRAATASRSLGGGSRCIGFCREGLDLEFVNLVAFFWGTLCIRDRDVMQNQKRTMMVA